MTLAYQAWARQFGPIFGAYDGILLVAASCAALFAIGRVLRWAMRHDPVTGPEYLLALALYGGQSFSHVMGSAAPIITGIFMVLYAAAIWLGARGSRSFSEEALGAAGLERAGPPSPPAALRRRD